MFFLWRKPVKKVKIIWQLQQNLIFNGCITLCLCAKNNNFLIYNKSYVFQYFVG